LQTDNIRGPLYSTAKLVRLKGVLPSEKRKREEFIANEFAKINLPNDIKISDIRVNIDDPPDILCFLNGKEMGIELTEFKVQHSPESIRYSSRLIDKIVREVLKKIPPEEVFIFQISTFKKNDNEIPKLKKRDINSIVDLLIHLIRSGKVNYIFREIPKSLNKLIKDVFVFRPTNADKSHTTSRENIDVKFDFINIVLNNTVLNNLISKIYREKFHMHAEMLLIWCSDLELMMHTEYYIPALIQKFHNSGFKYIFFFKFWNVKGPLFDKNKEIFLIKA
jgi:hypothetical protein